MRLGPILVPSAIVVAIGTIVAAQSGWLEGSGSEPTFLVRSDPAIHGAPPALNTAAKRTATSIAPATEVPTIAAEDADATLIGRSVGKNADSLQASRAMPALGSGGASLDADGAGSSAARPSQEAATSTPDALQRARDEAAKAKQDVFDVTQASIAAQHASEAEFERQKTELNEQIAQLRAKIDAASAQPPTSEAIAAADAKAATATAELADARERETALRAKLAAIQAGGNNDAERKVAADRIAAAENALAQAQARTKNVEDGSTALQAELAAAKAANDKLATAARADAGANAKIAADKIAAAEHAFADTQARAKALGDKVGALEAELAANRSAASLVVAKAASADRLKTDLDAARRQEDALHRQIATLEAGAAAVVAAKGAQADSARKVAVLEHQLDESRSHETVLGTKLAAAQASASAVEARVKQAEAAASHAVTLQQQFAASQGRERDLGVRLAALQSERNDASPTDGTVSYAKTSDEKTVASLQNDLAGARRGQDTLRRENAMLGRELAQERAAGKLIGEKLAALQVGMGQQVPAAADVQSRHDRAKTSGSEHARLVRQLDALRREQMHQEVQALKIEAAGLGRPKRGPGPQGDAVADQGARFGTEQPVPDARQSAAERRAARRRERQAREHDAAAGSPQASRFGDRSGALRQSDGADSQVIAQAGGLIRSGNIDQARQVLRQRGGAAATRALADTYNPLTNTQYGAIGVDSDAEKASYLYQQAARSTR